ncbi:hypothetical protein QWY31_16355 [Cytophagales bacterium LB-30]|uniref:Uncharacterized protein n=1 Tax=Shiella aurantiaca TaxID=3058365 RepID=A0ABT8FA01_9BACT|nr:hypothetical protein [Shiella aurantiaca]MDN4167084.1 hypothetical protein [Shiella aurantiaca]
MNKQKVRRAIALFLLLVLVNDILFPTVAYALTSGKLQPDYGGYEEPNATDMVNLLTGDFSYTLPLIDIPGPHGSYSFPLAYHAGVSPEQEASWVGLGWSLTVGSITRTQMGVYDDARGDEEEVYAKNEGIRGWNMNLLWRGEFGWNSMDGHYGAFNLDKMGFLQFEYGGGDFKAGVIGVYAGSNGVSVDPNKVMSDVMIIANAINTGGSSLVGDIIAKAASNGVAAATGAYKRDFTNMMVSSDFLQFQSKHNEKLLGALKEYSYWLDNSRIEKGYGALYLHDLPAQFVSDPTFNFTLNGVYEPLNIKPTVPNELVNSTSTSMGVASDFIYESEGYASSYATSTNAFSVGNDYYSVTGQGVSGSISPYRLESGFASSNRALRQGHLRFLLSNFKQYSNSSYNGKVQFKYENSKSNNYFYNLGSANSVKNNTDFFNGLNLFNTTSNSFSVAYNDYSLTGNGGYVKSNDNYFNNFKLAQNYHIEWYTNLDISSGDAPGFVEYAHGVNRDFILGEYRQIPSSDLTLSDGLLINAKYADQFQVGDNVRLKFYCSNGTTSFRDVSISSLGLHNGYTRVYFNNSSLPLGCSLDKIELLTQKHYLDPYRIGGYSITRPDGMTFHYALPIYNYGNVTRIEEVANLNNYSTMTNGEPFASAWLLTSVTGSDYIDTNNDGIANEGDWGMWTNFEYGKWSDSFKYREPFTGFRHSSDGESRYFTEGYRQQFYLNRVYTETHSAVFIKSQRLDAYGSNAAGNGMGLSSLKLNHIVLLSNETFSNFYRESGSDNINYFISGQCWQNAGQNGTLVTNVLNQSLNGVDFTHDYTLAQQTPNSSASNKGRLTLASINFRGNGFRSYMPSYRFAYNFNPQYGEYKYDNWGLYNSQGTSAENSHDVSTNPIDGSAWSLTSIISPTGGEIAIEYERDNYTSVSNVAYPFSTNPTPIDLNTTYSDLLSDRVLISNPSSQFQVGDTVLLDYTYEYSCIDPRTGLIDGVGYSNVSIASTIQSIVNSYVVFDRDIWMPNLTNCNDVDSYAFDGGTIRKKKTMLAGGLRVKTLKTTYGSESSKLEYRYTKDSSPTGYSSGVLSIAPKYYRRLHHIATLGENSLYKQIDNLSDYPQTPVLYGEVTLLSYTSKTSTSPVGKKKYSFITPDLDLMVKDYSLASNTQHLSPSLKVLSFDKRFDYFTSQIGSVKRIREYNPTGNVLLNTTTFNYTNELSTDQGLYTEALYLAEKVPSGSANYYRLGRSSKRNYATFLSSVEIVDKNGLMRTTTNNSFDFISGTENSVTTVREDGSKLLTEIVPAYSIYSNLGFKSHNISNKNMLSAVYSQKVSVLNAGGSVLGVKDASVTTWGNTQLYRTEANGTYLEFTKATSWLPNKTYVWIDDVNQINSLGYSTSFESFSTTNAKWFTAGNVNVRNKYQYPLETTDAMNNYQSSRFDLRQQHMILTATDARLDEVAYTGFENDVYLSGVGNEGYTDCNIKVSNVSNLYIGTSETDVNILSGMSSVRLNQSGQSVTYSIRNVDRASLVKDFVLHVWVKTAQVNLVNLFYKVNTQANVYDKTSVLTSGPWTLLELKVPLSTISNVSTIVFGLERNSSSAGTYAYVDDFKVQPVNAQAISLVYNTKGVVTHMFDANHLYVRTAYDVIGRPFATYKQVVGEANKERKITQSSQGYKTN